MIHRYVFHYDDNQQYEHDSSREYTRGEVTNLAAELKSRHEWKTVNRVEYQVVGEPTEVQLTRNPL